MTARRTNLLLVSLALTVSAYLLSLKPSKGTVTAEPWTAEPAQPAESGVRPAAAPEPAVIPPPEPASASEAARPPVQPVEERQDALLFESEALFGTPFGQSAVMPFD
jgi:hypothetical protein